MFAQKNPFKFGTIVDGSFFTDRVEELPKVRKMVSGHNQMAMSACGLAELLLKSFFSIHP